MNKNKSTIITYLNTLIFCLIAISCNETRQIEYNKDKKNFEDRINLLEQKVDSLMDSEVKEEALRRAKKEGFDAKRIEGSNE